MHWLCSLLLFSLAFLLLSCANRPISISLGDAADRALAHSSLTLPGSSHFHLKVEMSEPGSPNPDY